MAKAILDISIQAGYPYYMALDLNDAEKAKIQESASAVRKTNGLLDV